MCGGVLLFRSRSVRGEEGISCWENKNGVGGVKRVLRGIVLDPLELLVLGSEKTLKMRSIFYGDNGQILEF